MKTILKYDNTIPCANTMAAMKDFIVSKEINYTCMASSQNRFVLPNSSIAVNSSKCEKALCFLVQG